MQIVNDRRQVLRIDAPEWFAMPAFRAALERGTAPNARARLATYHRHDTSPNEYSDVFVPFEACSPDLSARHGEWTIDGADLLDEPGLERVRDAVTKVTHKLGISRGVLWLTNVGLSEGPSHRA